MEFLNALLHQAREALSEGDIQSAETAVLRLMELRPAEEETNALLLELHAQRNARGLPYLFPSWLGEAQSLDGVPGLLTRGDMEAFAFAARNSQGLALSIGVFKGLSMSVLHSANPDLRQVGIDACRGISGQLEFIVQERLDAALETLKRLGDARLIVAYSTEAAKDWRDPIDLLIIDGDHSPTGAMADLRDWSPMVRPGGRIVMHDAYARFSTGVALYRRTHQGDGPDLMSRILETSGAWELELVEGCSEVWRKLDATRDQDVAAMCATPERFAPALEGAPRAVELALAGEYAAALECLDRDAALLPRLLRHVPEVHMLRAVCLRRTGRPEQALDEAKAFLEREPSEAARRFVAELEFILNRNRKLELCTLKRELEPAVGRLAALQVQESAPAIAEAATALDAFLGHVADLEEQLLAEHRRKPSPWSMGYLLHRDATLRDMLDHVREHGALPDGTFGQGLDERVVEIPWALLKLGAAREIMDAGSALNHEAVLSRLADRKLCVVTLYPERYRSRDAVSYLYEDLRDLPFKDERFDAVVSLSTIEHIGFCAEGYKGGADLASRDTAQGGDLEAVREMLRVTRPGGAVHISAPFGDPASGGADFRVYDQSALDRLVNESGAASHELEYYLCGPQGWSKASAEACGRAAYRGDGAPAAQAVFLLALRKASRD